MPTKNPRLTITLEPLLAAQLRRLSELTGNSQSKLLSEMLEGSTVVFERVIRVLEAAQHAQAGIRGKVTQDMADAQQRVEQQLGLILDDIDQTTAPLLEDVEAIARRARKAPDGRRRQAQRGGGQPALDTPVSALLTPISNRGVRFSQPIENKGKQEKRGKQDHGQI